MADKCPATPTAIDTTQPKGQVDMLRQESGTRQTWNFQISLKHVVKHLSILQDEERIKAENALAKFTKHISPCSTRLERNVQSDHTQQEIWTSLLDEEWRMMGIRGRLAESRGSTCCWLGADRVLHAAAFEVYPGLGSFLHESEINSLAEEITTIAHKESLLEVLILGVLAVGRHVLEEQILVGSPVSELAGSRQLFTEACTRIKPFLLGHNSILKLQVSRLTSIRMTSSMALCTELTNLAHRF